MNCAKKNNDIRQKPVVSEKNMENRNEELESKSPSFAVSSKIPLRC